MPNSVEKISLLGNNIEAADDRVFCDITMQKLSLSLVAQKSFSLEMMGNSNISDLYMDIHNSKNNDYDESSYKCFISAPRLCAQSLILSEYCSDVLEHLECPMQMWLSINPRIPGISGKPTKITLASHPSVVRANKTVFLPLVQLGKMESPANFSTILFSEHYNNPNMALLICFDAGSLLVDQFWFFNVFVCEAALLSISRNAKTVSINDYSRNSFRTKTISSVFLEFSSLTSLLIFYPIDCTCAFAATFYEFVQRVQLFASCDDDNGTDAVSWVLENYDRCKDTSETLPDYDIGECKQRCLRSSSKLSLLGGCSTSTYANLKEYRLR